MDSGRRLVWCVLLFYCQLLSVTSSAADLYTSTPHTQLHEPVTEYSNQFAVQVPGGRPHADAVAREHGCHVRDQLELGEDDDYFLLECHSVHKRSLEPAHHHTKRLSDSKHVVWVDQQYNKKRKKRDGGSEGFFPGLFGDFSQPFSFHRPGGFGSGGADRTTLRHAQGYWPDPLYKEQWYLNGGAKDGSDMNVQAAWERGYTGNGVVVSILDDGIQPNHPDLMENYDPAASLDINDNDDDPTPRDDGSNRHGTRCAGEVAAVAGNNVCGVGVAPNASIGGVRMLDGGVNDYVEAKALSFHRNHIDIYSASWGPEDDGKTVDGPGPLARRAFIEGVLKGRQGKGSIFVWASGNGGQYVDNCNCDGYTNSIFTLSISSASQGGHKPWYLEECASTLASTYSSGTPLQDKSIATCDQDAALRPKHICTVSHTGTSASAPLAGGLCALTLEANPSLTWRDLQYIVLMTSRYEPLAKELGWLTNGVGRKVSHKFGYGLMDGAAMVELAERWTPVPPQHICISPIDSKTRMIPRQFGGQLHVAMDVSACAETAQTVHYLEHVQCKVTLTYVPRGNLRILLTSPVGTVSTLLYERPRDVTGSSFDRWPFMSVHFWGEDPRGVWNLTIINTHTRASKMEGVLKEWQMILYGTEQDPIRVQQADTFKQFGSASVLRPTVVGRSGKAPFSFYCSPFCVEKCVSQLSSDQATCSRCREEFKSDCSRTCETGFYLDSAEVCRPCSSTCRNCFGPHSVQCLDCTQDSYLIPELSTCVVSCPDEYYTVNGTTCVPCPAHCASCSEDGQCLSCADTFLLHETGCVSTCPTGTYRHNGRCERCSEGCESCVDAGEERCLLCAPGLVYTQGRCRQLCPPGTYVEGGECVPCHPTCAACNTAAECTSCPEGLTLVGVRCVPDSACGQAEYVSDSGVCAGCHSTCGHCSGPSAVDCLICAGSSMVHNGLCYSNCPAGFAGTSGYCLPCRYGCQDCLSEDRLTCTLCHSDLIYFNSTCLTNCHPGTFVSGDECVPCDVTCATCHGPGRHACLSCATGHQLADSTCHVTCPNSWFPGNPGSCSRCHSSCRTCDAVGQNSCTSCWDGFQHRTADSSCSPCGAGQFYNRQLGSCSWCHDSCSSCIAAGRHNCTTCTDGLVRDRTRELCLPCCLQNTTQHHSDCCHCGYHTGGCVRSTTRRRTVGSSSSAAGRTTSSFRTPGYWLNMQALLGCAASVIIFIIVFSILQCRRPAHSSRAVFEMSDLEERLNLTDHCNHDNREEAASLQQRT